MRKWIFLLNEKVTKLSFSFFRNQPLEFGFWIVKWKFFIKYIALPCRRRDLELGSCILEKTSRIRFFFLFFIFFYSNSFFFNIFVNFIGFLAIPFAWIL